jgi:nucleotide-binding universal stress UspA family protein
MDGYGDILLPTDGSEGTEAAAEHAGLLARTHGATVHVLSAVDTRNRFETPASGIAADVWTETERERATESITGAVAQLPEDIDVERHIDEGVPRSVIVDHIDELDADIVVMGTHGRTGLSHYLIGSVTEKVVRTSSVPVVTVPLEAEES